MVLKVVKNVKEWFLVCGVFELWVIRHDKKEPPNPECQTIGEINFVAKVFDEQKPTPEYTEILYRDGDGGWNQIEFNTEAYLCNDYGKTIEKIYG